jgi:hypothetical protein
LGTATIEISTRPSAFASGCVTTTVVRAGGSFGKYVEYTSFMAAKSLAFRRYTRTLAAFARLDPPALSVAAILSNVCLVCALMSPLAIAPAAPVPSVPAT